MATSNQYKQSPSYVMNAIRSHRFFADKHIHSITVLSGGLIHTVCRVSTNKGIFITRSHPNRLTNTTEVTLQNNVARLGFSPWVIEHDEQTAVIEYIEGQHLIASKWSQNVLVQFAGELADIHQLNIPAGLETLNVIEKITEYRQQLTLSDTDEKHLNDEIIQLKKLTQFPSTIGLCHNDLNPQNIICTQNKRYLLDWEYAAVGDVFFDLAGFIVEHQLTTRQTEGFLKAYFARNKTSTITSEMNERLELMKTAYRLTCRLWYLIHQA